MTSGAQHVVVVGAGHAGVEVVDSLRSEGFDDLITVIGDEPTVPYQRPPLSKELLSHGSQAGAEPLPLRPAGFFERSAVDLRLGARVVEIDRPLQTVVLDDGSRITYTSLVLATGSEPRGLPTADPGTAGVHALRTFDDAQRLRTALRTATSAVVVGAGFIGLEFAAAARARGIEVAVIEAGPRPLGRALSTVMADHLTVLHQTMGTSFFFDTAAAHLVEESGQVTHVVDSKGVSHPADVVLVGIGAAPRDEIAQECGLEVNGGIVVDHQFRTTDPHIYAVGDCAVFPGPAGQRTRLESVQNAGDQARHVVGQILGAANNRYRAVPWFWSTQGPIRLQIAGLAEPMDDAVVGGATDDGRFSVYRFRGDQLVAVESLARPADHVAARRLLATGLLPLREQVQDPDFDLKSHVRQLQPAR